MIRSLLFVPGARPERFDKARAAGADAVCIDLEDAVPPDSKAAARGATLEYLATGQGRVGLRVNSVRSGAGLADLAALLASGLKPPLLMVPKVAHAEELAILAEALALETPALWPIVESAAGLRNAYDIAAAPGVAGILFGGADYTADIGAAHAWEPMLFARSTLANACAAAGIELLDVPHLDVEDEAGLAESSRRVRALGFTGRACIHPKQVGPVTAAFTPSGAELAHARCVVAAFDAAKGAAALLDGKLIELPVIRAARRALAAAGEA